MILAGGHYKQTQNYYFVAAILNIVVAIATVKIWGLNGVAFGSLVAMLFHTIWMTIYNFKNLVKWPLRNVLKQIFVDILAVFLGIIATMSYKMASLSYFSWCVLALKTAATWALILLLINCLFYREKVSGIINAMKRFVGKRKR
jgi:peptidoglycan biosynthesis protein MviN/MurJ (putative lipid II flippase)